LSEEDRVRLDERDDFLFWGKPRMVVHNDMQFAIRLEKLYRERLPIGSSILDLGASCTTFLPDIPFARVVGLGMNMEELDANEALTERLVQDLNAYCSLPFPDESFDAVICSGTLHYLRNPEAVLAEVRRVLRPSGAAIISFSDRFFDSKAFSAWRSRGTLARCDLVAECINAAGGMTPPQRFLEMSPLTALSHLVPAARGVCGGDPFAALVSYKGSPPAGWAVRLDNAADVRLPVLGITVPSLKMTPFAAVFLLYVILSHR
jgi:SAM-dependent methyltransferase